MSQRTSMRDISAGVYDELILRQGVQFQIDTYYETKDSAGKRRIKTVLEALNPKAGEKVLDIGCGVGAFAFHCGTLTGFSVEIDYSFESLRAASEICKRYAQRAHTKFVVANAVELPFKGGSFDKIVSADFVEHITFDEKKQLLNEMLRLIKQQGIIVIFTPNKIRKRIGEIYWKIRHMVFKDKIPFTDLHFGLTTRSAFEGLLKTRTLNFRLFYRDITRPYLARIPLLKRLLALNLLWVIKNDAYVR